MVNMSLIDLNEIAVFTLRQISDCKCVIESNTNRSSL